MTRYIDCVSSSVDSNHANKTSDKAYNTLQSFLQSFIRSGCLNPITLLQISAIIYLQFGTVGHATRRRQLFQLLFLLMKLNIRNCLICFTTLYPSLPPRSSKQYTQPSASLYSLNNPMKVQDRLDI